MGERQWWGVTDPNRLLIFTRPRLSQRKQRLLSCALCRDLEGGSGGRLFWDIIRLAERWADGDHDPEAVAQAEATFWQLFDERHHTSTHDRISHCMHAMSCLSELDPLHLFVQPVPSGWGRLREIGRDVGDWWRLGVSYRKRQPLPQSWCGVIRDICGNPFCPVSADPGWLTSDVVALATGIYEERAFDRMPILADALQDAGCDNDDILNHCRQADEHVRGCWVVDLVMGKK